VTVDDGPSERGVENLLHADFTPRPVHAARSVRRLVRRGIRSKRSHAKAGAAWCSRRARRCATRGAHRHHLYGQRNGAPDLFHCDFARFASFVETSRRSVPEFSARGGGWLGGRDSNPITWSREPWTGSRPVLSVRFHAVLLRGHFRPLPSVPLRSCAACLFVSHPLRAASSVTH
jgi:hypothetical protein